MKRLLFTIQEIYNKLSKDNLASYASQTCFYILLSFVPALILLLVLVKQINLSPELVSSFISKALPTQISDLIATQLSNLSSNTTTTVTGITIITIIWSAGKGFMAIIDGLDVIYNTNSNRNWFLQRLLSILYTISFLLAFIAAMLLIVFGNTIFNFLVKILPQFAYTLNAIINNRIIFICCFLLIIFLCMYRIIPNRKSSIMNELPGAILSTIGWYLFSFSFSLYVNYSPNFASMYGSLTSLIFALMMLYFCMYIFFLGAELNICIQSGIIQLHRKKKLKSICSSQNNQ